LIHNYASVVELGWQPEDASRPHMLRNNQLKGHYILKVKKAGTGELVDVIPTSDWVEANFSPKLIATAQKAFFSYFEKVPVRHHEGLKKIDYEIGFVDVEDADRYVVLDDEQINKLKYIPPKKMKVGPIYEIESYRTTGTGTVAPIYKLDKNNQRIRTNKEDKEERLIEEKWAGYCKDKKKIINLTWEFVKANFTSGYLDQVKHLSKHKNARWISIPPGADKLHENAPEYLQTGPEVKYRQTKGERFCLVYSFASALHHTGLHCLASWIYQAADSIVEQHNTFVKFSKFIQQKSRHMFHQKLKLTKWNILENGENDLVMVSIKSSDGKEDHCVTLFGKWIFDSNFKKALPLCKEALDLCCSSDTVINTFDSVVQAWKFPHFLYVEKSLK
jgi:hypothetical protein